MDLIKGPVPYLIVLTQKLALVIKYIYGYIYIYKYIKSQVAKNVQWSDKSAPSIAPHGFVWDC